MRKEIEAELLIQAVINGNGLDSRKPGLLPLMQGVAVRLSVAASSCLAFGQCT